MFDNEYFSVRMHSSQRGQHHSGAERLCRVTDVDNTGRELIQRAMRHSRGKAESISLKIEAIPGSSIRPIALLPIQTRHNLSVDDARNQAIDLLKEAGVAQKLASQAVNSLANGANGQGGTMRGAMLIDVDSQRRCEPDTTRGVRVSRMDILPELKEAYEQVLTKQGLNRPQVREALILASKVVAAPAILAELCWSDDPDYTTGYVAARGLGYVRLPGIKAPGDRLGGRVLFFRASEASITDLIEYLECAPVLVTTIPEKE